MSNPERQYWKDKFRNEEDVEKHNYTQNNYRQAMSSTSSNPKAELCEQEGSTGKSITTGSNSNLLSALMEIETIENYNTSMTYNLELSEIWR